MTYEISYVINLYFGTMVRGCKWIMKNKLHLNRTFSRCSNHWYFAAVGVVDTFQIFPQVLRELIVNLTPDRTRSF